MSAPRFLIGTRLLTVGEEVDEDEPRWMLWEIYRGGVWLCLARSARTFPDKETARADAQRVHPDVHFHDPSEVAA